MCPGHDWKLTIPLANKQLDKLTVPPRTNDIELRRAATRVGHAQRLQLRYAVDPSRLHIDEHAHHGPQLGAAGVVVILTRYVGVVEVRD